MSNGYSYNDPNDIIFLPFQEGLDAIGGKQPSWLNTECKIVTDEKPLWAEASLYCPAAKSVNYDNLDIDFAATEDFTVDFYMRFQGGGHSGVSSAVSFGAAGIILCDYGVCYGNGSGGYTAWLFAAQFVVNAWAHYAFVKKEGKNHWFINGKLVDTSTVNSIVPTSRILSINNLYANGAYASYCGAAHFAFVRASKVARWTEDFIPPSSFLGSCGVVENYQKEDGTTIAEDRISTVTKGEDFTAVAAVIEGYELVGYRVDNGALVAGDSVSLLAVAADRAVLFVYKVQAVVEPVEYCMVRERYQDENGSELKAELVNSIVKGESYTALAPVLAGYELIGYQLDGGALLAGDSVVLSELISNQLIVFVYQLDDGQAVEYFTVHESYEDEAGVELRSAVDKVIRAGNNYAALAPVIAGYSLLGYRVDAGQLLAGESVSLLAVAAGHAVVFVYKADEGEETKSYRVTEGYQAQDGSVVKAEVVKTITAGEDYLAKAAVISGYTLVGYKLDGGVLRSGSSVTLSAVSVEHTVLFVYRKNTNNGNSSSGRYCGLRGFFCRFATMFCCRKK